jgi:branched-chain amino acid aminotransferase
MEEIVYLNGSLVPHSKALISVNDHALLYGFGVFQGIRAYNGKLFLLDRHIKRLHDSAKVVGLEWKIAGIDFAKICKDTLAANKLISARVRITVSNGINAAMPWVDSSGEPTIIATAKPYTAVPEDKYNAGYRLGIASVTRMKQSLFSTIKSTDYLLNVVARMEAASKGLDEAILLNDEGYIAEGGSGNIFFVKEGKLITPALNSGIIGGVTREAVIELADSLQINVSEGPVGIGAIKKSNEIFLTNANIEVMPVTAVSDNEGNTVIIGDGKPGALTRKLMAAYKEMVERETA